MSLEGYPPESQKMDMIGHLEELRRRILVSLGFLGVAGIICFIRGADLILLAKRPGQPYVSEMIFIAPTEVFASYIRIALLAGFILSSPAIFYQMWAFLAPAVKEQKHKAIFFWVLSFVVCLLAGVLFSYFVAFPAALRFLLGFGQGVAAAHITLSKYISFFSAFLLIGGVTFEIPVVIGFLADIGVVRASGLRKKRPMALIGILVAAAMITPTQDIFNLLIFALPMYALYECGILGAGLIEGIKKKADEKRRRDENKSGC